MILGKGELQMPDDGEPPGGAQGRPRRSGPGADRPALRRSPRPAHGGGVEGRGAKGSRRAAVGSRGVGATRDMAAKPPGSGASSRLSSPPAPLRMMAEFRKSRLAELESSIAAETRPELLGTLAVEWMCVHGILAGLDSQPGAA